MQLREVRLLRPFGEVVAQQLGVDAGGLEPQQGEDIVVVVELVDAHEAIGERVVGTERLVGDRPAAVVDPVAFPEVAWREGQGLPAPFQCRAADGPLVVPDDVGHLLA